MDDLDLRYGVEGWLRAQWESLKPQELKAIADSEMLKSSFYNAGEKYELLGHFDEALQAYLLSGDKSAIDRFLLNEFKNDLDTFGGDGASFLLYEGYEPHYVGDEVDSYFSAARMLRELGNNQEALRTAKLAVHLAMGQDVYKKAANEIFEFLDGFVSVSNLAS